MKRREFSSLLALAPAMPTLALAQGAPAEGQQYTRLATPVATSAAGKIEVIEFFWYGCPHCNAFDPSVNDWAKALPADVAFRRVHVAFDALKERHQRLFYALESLNLEAQLHAKVMARFHVEHKPLNTEADMIAFGTENGIEAARMDNALKSFSVIAKMRQARQLTDEYKVDGVPMIGIQGRYTTSPAQAGSHENALRVTNTLIAQLRKAG